MDGFRTSIKTGTNRIMIVVKVCADRVQSAVGRHQFGLDVQDCQRHQESSSTEI